VLVLSGVLDRDDATLTPTATTPGATTPAETTSPPATSGSSSTTSSTSSTTTTTSSTTTSTTTTSSTTSVPTVEVVASDYVGRKIKQVTSDLEALGLVVDAVPDPASEAPKDEVTAVEEGTYQEGDTVTVTYSDAQPGPPGDGDDQGGDD